MNRRRRFATLLVLLLTLLSASAQQQTITGHLLDGQHKQPLSYAVVQLLGHDSTYVSGTTSDDTGRFVLQAPRDGNYILKVSFVGMRTLCRDVALSAESKGTDVGTLTLRQDEHVLREVTIAAQAPKVVLKNDTFQYNASAYRVAEGSTVEALVKVLPGAEVSDDGTVKINGKEVKKILVDGKEFMTGDTKTALKNLPASIIEKVKAYDQQSDLARVTGIDDGEEQTVLDFGMKKGMNKGFFSNISLSLGTHGRYSERGMAAYFKDKFRMMGFASANNVGDMMFGGGPRGGFGQMRQGLNSSKMAGINMNYDNGKTFQWDGSLRWNHNDGDLSAKVFSDNFVAAQRAYSNRLQQKYTRSNSWDGRFRLEWTPDSMWNIMFRPSLQLSKSDELDVSSSATFSDDPYSLTDDPLSEPGLAAAEAARALVNRQKNTTVSYGDNTAAAASLQINRKLSANGRNVTLRLDGNYKDADSKTFSTQDLQYFQMLDATGQDSLYHAYRYNLMPTKSHSLGVEATYSEPLASRTYLQLSYQYSYGFNKSDRSTYDFSRLGSGFFGSVVPDYRSWGSYLALLQSPLEDYFDQNLSRYSEYRTHTQNIQLMIRTSRAHFRFNAGVQLQPQHSIYQQDYLGVHVDTVRNTFNWSPTLDLRYKFSQQSSLRINYRGTATQPTMSQLLDITDNTDPQNVSVGNPGLRPAFTHRLRLFYNGYRQKYTQSWMTFLNFSSVRNAIGNSVTYDAVSGARVVRPVNINGNWNVDAAVMFNSSIDTLGVWNVNTFTTAAYNRYASLLQQSRSSAVERNVTNQTTLGERLTISYRNSWLEVALDGSVDYNRTQNQLQSAQDLNTWRYAYGGSINLTAPWGTSISTDIHMNSRRGYNDAALNSNELLWNAQVAQSFLKGKPLTISLQLYDILHRQSNLSRAVNDMGRTDTEYNSINSYALLTLSYRFNLFGGKPQRPSGGARPGDDDGGPGMPPPPDGGRAPMGGSGGRPPMGGPGGRPF